MSILHRILVDHMIMIWRATARKHVLGVMFTDQELCWGMGTRATPTPRLTCRHSRETDGSGYQGRRAGVLILFCSDGSSFPMSVRSRPYPGQNSISVTLAEAGSKGRGLEGGACAGVCDIEHTSPTAGCSLPMPLNLSNWNLKVIGHGKKTNKKTTHETAFTKDHQQINFTVSQLSAQKEACSFLT